jgi:hypothetical protein
MALSAARTGVPNTEGFKMVKAFNPGGHKGKLHREMGVPEGTKIPAKALRAAATQTANPEKRRDAIRAETMKKWHHTGRKK